VNALLLRKTRAQKNYKQLSEMLRPAIRAVTIGTGDSAVAIGGKLVMYRHEFTYFNPTAIAINVTDETQEECVRSN
jgi:acetyl-CoA decarbonylase/synthase complex subunit gamma